MARSRLKAKGRKDGGRFAMLPDAVLRSPEYHQLPGGAVRVLLALAAQYNGNNNGNLCAALTVVRNYGLNSSDTVSTNLRRLEQASLIVRTRDGMFCGGASTCALFALTWRPIDACPGKRLTVAPTDKPLRSFQPATLAKRPVRKSERTDPETGAEK